MAGIGNGNEVFSDETLGFLYTKPEYSHKKISFPIGQIHVASYQ